jgi:hypothetical protein
MIEEIGLDAEGRVAVTNPEIAARLRRTSAAVRGKPAPAPNTNCETCNTAKGCDGTNDVCHPNTVPNCGCRKIA